MAIASRQPDPAGARSRLMTTQDIVARSTDAGFPERFRLGARAVRELVTALETMGLVETWIDSRGRQGRVKRVATTFDPEWVHAAQPAFIEQYEAQTTNVGETE